MKVVSVLLLLSLMVSCSARYSTSSDQQYMHSRNAPELVVPAPLTSSNISSFYVLPPQNENAQVEVVPPVA